jgi:hypothetical protein
MCKQADEYYECAEKTYTELMAIPDPEADSALDNDEDDETSSTGAPTPTPLHPSPTKTTPQPLVHNINVNYRHCYSVQRTNGDEVDIPALLQSIAQHSSIEAPSALAPSSQIATSIPSAPLKAKEKTLVLKDSENPLVFTALDISDPPHIKYSDDMDALVLDWNESSYLKIKGVAIPLKYWAQVFRWARPEAWNVIKDNWSNWRVCHLSRFPRTQRSLFCLPSYHSHKENY